MCNMKQIILVIDFETRHNSIVLDTIETFLKKLLIAEFRGKKIEHLV